MSSDIVPITLDLDEISMADGLDTNFEIDAAPVSLLLRIKIFLKYRMSWLLGATVIIGIVILFLQHGDNRISMLGFGNADSNSFSEQLASDGEDGNSVEVASDILETTFAKSNTVVDRPQDGLTQYEREDIKVEPGSDPSGDERVVVTPGGVTAKILRTDAGYEYLIQAVELELDTSAEYESLFLTIGIEADFPSAQELLEASAHVSDNLGAIASDDDMDALSIFQILDHIRMQLKKRLIVSRPELSIGRIHVHEFSVERRR